MFRSKSIKRTVMGAILLTSGTVLMLTCGTFLIYELVTFRAGMVGNLRTLARIMAANSTAALAFDNPEDATIVLSALSAEEHIVAAGLYDKDGTLFAIYPANRASSAIPARPGGDQHQFTRTSLEMYEPVVNDGRHLGTLYLQSDLLALYRRLAVYGGMIAAVLTLSFVVAIGLSMRLQSEISQPVLALVTTAADVAEHQDYSKRAMRYRDDELGTVTDAFNGMLARIQEQDREVHALNASLEQRVEERTQALAAANKELEAFSYSVSHDLRAPLRAIAGFSRILIDDHLDTLPSEAANYLQRVAAGANQMGHLIDDLLAFSRLGRSPLQRRLVEPEEIVRNVLADLETDLDGRDVSVSIEPLPPCQADHALLKQVYVNLLTNAIKFTRHCAKPSIQIGCQAANGHSPVYFVKDNGAGFDMKYANKLFGVFQRLHRSDEYEGTGVGLAIVHRVIARHGGRVWAEGSPGAGARFYFTIGENR